MKKRFLISLSLMSLFTPAFSDYQAKIEIVVDKKALTKRDIDSRISLMLAMTRQENTPENRLKMSQKAIEMLVKENLQIKEVSEKLKKEGIITNKDISRHIKAIAEQNNMTESEFLDALKSSIPDKDTNIIAAFKKQIHAQLAWSKFTRYLGGHVSDLEVERFQKKMKEQQEEILYDIDEIVFHKKSDRTDDSLKGQAGEILKQLKKGGSFYTFAQQFSDSATTNEGGKLGKRTPQQIDPIILKGLRSMNPGDISLFETSRGFEIIKLNSVTKNNQKIEDVINFKIVNIPFNPQTITEQDYKSINYKVSLLKSSSSLPSFLKVAKDLSLNTTSVKDVVVSNVQPEEFSALLKKSKPGDVLDPIQTPDGIQIIFIEKKGVKQNKPLTKQEINHMLLFEKQAKIAESYINKLIARSMVDFKSSAQKKMQRP